MSNPTVTFLRNFNRWRRGDEGIEQPCADEVGKAIDDACEQIEQLEQDLRKARDTVHRLRKQRAIARHFGEQLAIKLVTCPSSHFTSP